MTRIYTRSGDKGTTSLLYGVRVPKNDLRVEAYGTCDEANSLIGLAISFLRQLEFPNKVMLLHALHKVQTNLFHVGSYLSTPEGKEVQWKLTEEDVKVLETEIDRLQEELPELKTFILPGGHPAAATLHVARTVVRRAERLAVGINNIDLVVLSYLNRLSDFLFVAGRFVNYSLQIEDERLHEGDHS